MAGSAVYGELESLSMCYNAPPPQLPSVCARLSSAGAAEAEPTPRINGQARCNTRPPTPDTCARLPFTTITAPTQRRRRLSLSLILGVTGVAVDVVLQVVLQSAFRCAHFAGLELYNELPSEYTYPQVRGWRVYPCDVT
jgi:hypothetical protein